MSDMDLQRKLRRTPQMRRVKLNQRPVKIEESKVKTTARKEMSPEMSRKTVEE